MKSQLLTLHMLKHQLLNLVLCLLIHHAACLVSFSAAATTENAEWCKYLLSTLTLSNYLPGAHRDMHNEVWKLRTAPEPHRDSAKGVALSLVT